jgi:hypothetical protein
VTIQLPDFKGGLRSYEPRPEPLAVTSGTPFTSRTVFSAAHVVADPFADTSPDSPAAVDWDATLAFRRHLWSHGLGVAEAMDTAQRGMGLDWAGAAELIRRSAAEAKAVGGRIACGVGTDQLTGPASLADVRAAYEEQLALVEESGAQAILMASRALAAVAKGPEDYLEVYGHLLRQSSEPVVLHWLGPMFDPALEGYWGSSDLDAATDTFLEVIAAHPDKVDGIKVSLLEAQREIDIRRRLPQGVRCYTGDDFNYPELIAGDEQGFSHALLGIFDPLATQAAQAFELLDAGDVAGFRGVLDPLVPLARHIFAAPTQFYKTGVVFLAYLSGYQEHFKMVGGQETGRDSAHLTKLYEMAVDGGILPDADLAAARFKEYAHG